MRNFRRVHVLMRASDSGRILARDANPLALHDDPAGGAGSGSGKGGDEPGSGSGRGGSQSGPTDEGKAVARKLISRFRGRAEDAIAVLADENRELRDERRALRDKVPKDGSRILTADEAKVYDEFKALGTPADVAAKVKEHATLSASVAETTRLTAADKAAALAGFNTAAMRELVKDKNLDVTFVAGVDAAGKAIEVPHVKAASDKDAKPIALTEFAKASPLFLPALMAKDAAQGAAGGTTTAPRGTQFVEQGSASGSTGTGAETKQRPSVTTKYDNNAPWNRGKDAAAAATK